MRGVHASVAHARTAWPCMFRRCERPSSPTHRHACLLACVRACVLPAYGQDLHGVVFMTMSADFTGKRSAIALNNGTVDFVLYSNGNTNTCACWLWCWQGV